MDLDAIKSKLNQLQSTTSTSNNFWKPEPGTQIVRVVPYKYNKDNPFIELYFHYNLGNKTYMSPVSFGRPDPVQEFADKLKSTGDKDEWIQGMEIIKGVGKRFTGYSTTRGSREEVGDM